MKTDKQIFFLCIAIMLQSFSLSSQVLAQDQNSSNKEKAVSILESLNTGDLKPIGFINPNNYIQHNLGVADGLAGFGEVMKNAPAGGFKANVVRAFQDGDFVFTHTEYDFFGPKAGFDIFRFEDGKVVEHWDNLAAISGPNPSGRTQFDGAVEVVDLDKTEANKQVVRKLLNEVFIGGQMGKIAQYISPKEYLQHNSFVADGLAGLAAAFKDPNAPKIECKKLHKVLGEGNFALSVSEGTYGGQKVAFYDLFRLKDGLVVEHWDVIEKIPPAPQRKNMNGKFNFDGVIEVTTFKAKPTVDATAFKSRDRQVESDFTAKQPGFIKRQSGVNEKGEYVVVVYWQSMTHAAASMNKFMSDGSVADYAQMIDSATMQMSRFSLDEPFDANEAKFVEVMSFDVNEGTDIAKFDSTNKEVETEFTGARDGFVQRLTGVDENGKQVVAVYWSNRTKSDASLQPFMQAPIAKAFMQNMNQSTISMGRYQLFD